MTLHDTQTTQSIFSPGTGLNYANAADELCLSQSALSLTIKALEEELGEKLFKRTTRLVNLTHEGHALIPYARKLLANWEDMEKDVKQRFQLHHWQFEYRLHAFCNP